MPRPLSLRSRISPIQLVSLALLMLLLICATGAIIAGATVAGLLGICASIVVHAIAIRAITGTALKPLSRLSAVANEIDSVTQDCRFPATGTGDETDELASALNRMLARIERPILRMQEFPHDLAHELRRPLSVLRAESELALRSAKSLQEYRDVLTRQTEHIDRMIGVLSNMVASASVDGQPRLKKVEQSLSEILKAAADGMVTLATERNVELRTNVAEGITGEIDACQMYRMLQNLIDNAIKYSRPSGHVYVNVNQLGNSTAIVVSDNGLGISSASLPHVFDRSYRSSDAATSSANGMGLGLSYVKAAVDAHGGQIGITSMEGRGTSVRILLPGTRTTPHVASLIREYSVQGHEFCSDSP